MVIRVVNNPIIANKMAASDRCAYRGTDSFRCLLTTRLYSEH